MLRWYHLIGISSAIAMNILVLLTIYVPASFNEKGLSCVTTNSMGEHWYEFIYLTIGFIIFLDFVRLNYQPDRRRKEPEIKKENEGVMIIDEDYIRLT